MVAGDAVYGLVRFSAFVQFTVSAAAVLIASDFDDFRTVGFPTVQKSLKSDAI